LGLLALRANGPKEARSSVDQNLYDVLMRNLPLRLSRVSPKVIIEILQKRELLIWDTSFNLSPQQALPHSQSLKVRTESELLFHRVQP